MKFFSNFYLFDVFDQEIIFLNPVDNQQVLKKMEMDFFLN
jgi:hypothetical protein